MLRNNKENDRTTTANGSHIMSEPFDYTEWQKDLYGDMSLDEFYEKVKAARGSK